MAFIEGLDEDDDQLAPAAGAPIDPDEFFASSAFRIIYQTNNFLLPQLRDLIDRGEVLNLRPEYQRRFRWSTAQKSRLIESLLLNIPIPPVFLYESDAARYEVMDGQQRLNAVQEFIAGDYALSGLQVLRPLNGLRYSRCPPRIKRALDRSSLSAIVLLLESDPANGGAISIADIRRFVFDRLNTGGTRLNPQEIRNAIYPGAFNRELVEMSRLPVFTEIFEIPPYVEADPSEYYENEQRQKNTLYATMGDCQLVLRYFALNDDENIRGSMKSMLDRGMQSRTGMSVEDAAAERIAFNDRLSLLYRLFDGRPFRLPRDEQGRSRISAALYDASMVAIDRHWESRADIEADKENIMSRLAAALARDDQLALLTGQANTAQAVRDRINLMSSILIVAA
ncbi:DUF262 domain-containing protein [Brevundimonas sp.]|uniref:DUF262 domain-containing protein n=1 Tax=Brevundimonas sp. TaxID=1871086 RepID=UPI0028A02B98|nr:DUF262 domain-containing protein [Brevundimonas sp.]